MRTYADIYKKYRVFRILSILFVFDWVHIPVGAVQPYEPNTVDPLLKPWCWYHTKTLDGLVFNEEKI
jgi:hypothetical protein